MPNDMNNALPFEVLKMVFQYHFLEYWPGNYLKTYLTVCKSWYMAARDVQKLFIRVDEDSLEKLLKDIVFFAQKVKKISLWESKSVDINRTITCLIWRNILLDCPNLTLIKITNFDNDSNYVQCLMDLPAESLGHVQSFDISSLEHRFKVNLKYCKTVTSICIFFLMDFLHVNETSLVNFVSHFPNLTSLTLDDTSDEYPLDIIQLLKVATQLQEFEVYGAYEIKKSSNSEIMSENTCLTVLELSLVEKMDVDSLIFTATCLKKLKRLSMYIENLTSTVPQDEAGKFYSAEELLKALKDYTKDISDVFIRFQFNDAEYVLRNDQKPHIVKQTPFSRLIIQE